MRNLLIACLLLTACGEEEWTTRHTDGDPPEVGCPNGRWTFDSMIATDGTCVAPGTLVDGTLVVTIDGDSADLNGEGSVVVDGSYDDGERCNVSLTVEDATGTISASVEGWVEGGTFSAGGTFTPLDGSCSQGLDIHGTYTP